MSDNKSKSELPPEIPKRSNSVTESSRFPKITQTKVKRRSVAAKDLQRLMLPLASELEVESPTVETKVDDPLAVSKRNELFKFYNDIDTVIKQYQLDLALPTKREISTAFNSMAKASSNVTQIMKKEGTRNIGELIKRLYLDTRLSTYLYDLINSIGGTILQYIEKDKSIHIRTIRETTNPALSMTVALTNLIFELRTQINNLVYEMNNPPPLNKDTIGKYKISIRDVLLLKFPDIKEMTIKDSELREALVMSCGTIETMTDLLNYHKGLITSLIENSIDLQETLSIVPSKQSVILQTKVNKLEGEIQRMKDSYEEKLYKYKTEARDIKSKYDQLKQEDDALQFHYKSLQSEMKYYENESEKKIRGADLMAEKLKDEITKLRRQVAQKDKELQDKVNDLRVLTAESNDLQYKAKSNEERDVMLNSFQKKCVDHEKQIDNLKQQLLQNRVTIKGLEEKLNDTNVQDAEFWKDKIQDCIKILKSGEGESKVLSDIRVYLDKYNEDKSNPLNQYASISIDRSTMTDMTYQDLAFLEEKYQEQIQSLNSKLADLARKLKDGYTETLAEKAISDEDNKWKLALKHSEMLAMKHQLEKEILMVKLSASEKLIESKRHENRTLQHQIEYLNEDLSELKKSLTIKQNELNHLMKKEHQMIRDGSLFGQQEYKAALADENESLSRGYEEEILTLKETIRNMRKNYQENLKQLAEENMSEKVKYTHDIVNLEATLDLYKKYYKLSPPPNED